MITQINKKENSTNFAKYFKLESPAAAADKLLFLLNYNKMYFGFKLKNVLYFVSLFLLHFFLVVVF